MAETEVEHVVVKARHIAEQAHAGQKRKEMDDDYVLHCLRVAEAARSIGLDEDAQAAAWLHDVVEDTPLSLDDLIGAGIPQRTIDLVRLLTKWWPDGTPSPEVARSKRLYYAAIATDQEAITLKLLDRADNLADMLRMYRKKRKWAEAYLRKTDVEFPPLLRACVNKDAATRFYVAVGALRTALSLFDEES